MANYYIRNFAAPRLGNTYVETKIIHLNRIPVPNALLPQSDLFAKLTDIIIASIKYKKNTATQFLKRLIDTCVMECYFPDHMAKTDLAVIRKTEALLDSLNPSTVESVLAAFSAIAADEAHPLVARIARRAAASPYLLGVILQEGEVGESDGDACATAPVLPPKRKKTTTGPAGGSGGHGQSGSLSGSSSSASSTAQPVPDTAGLFTSAPEASARPFTPKAAPTTDIVVEIERRTTIEDISQEESLARIRKVFEAAGTREGAQRDEALKDLSRQFGFKRLGSNIREELESDLRTAVRRRIIERVNGDGTYRLATRSIEDYLDEGRDKYATLRQFVCAAVGTTWTPINDAITKTARHLGFARTGENIRATLETAFNSAINKGELEKRGGEVRVKG